MQKTLGDTYAPAIATEGLNYVRYLGPLHHARTRHLFLSVRQGELVVTVNREPTKMWSIDHLDTCQEKDMNHHACSLKRDGTQTYLSSNLPTSGNKGEATLGPQTRFDISRANHKERPCYIVLYQEPCAPDGECCEESREEDESTEPQPPADRADDNDIPMDVDTETEAPEEVCMAEKPPPVEWYLGVSEDFKVVLKAFPPMSECPAELASQRPIWEFTSRDEAINQDHPTPVAADPAWDPVVVKNPSRKYFYTNPKRLEVYDTEYWPDTVFNRPAEPAHVTLRSPP